MDEPQERNDRLLDECTADFIARQIFKLEQERVEIVRKWFAKPGEAEWGC
jgi:hypothetical protein